MTEKERKHQDICKDIQVLLDKGLRLQNACATVGHKYYLSPDTIYNIVKVENQSLVKENPIQEDGKKN